MSYGSPVKKSYGNFSDFANESGILEEDMHISEMPNFIEALEPADNLITALAFFLREAKKGVGFLKFGRIGSPHSRIFYTNIEPFNDEGMTDENFN